MQVVYASVFCVYFCEYRNFPPVVLITRVQRKTDRVYKATNQ